MLNSMKARQIRLNQDFFHIGLEKKIKFVNDHKINDLLRQIRRH